MFSKTKLSFLLFFTLTFIILASRCYEYKDPDEDLHRCQLKCARPLQPFRQQAACEQKCLEQHKGGKSTSEEQERGSQEPERRYGKCQEKCESEEHGRHGIQSCHQKCEEEYRESRDVHGGEGRLPERKKGKEEEEIEEDQNPYYFEGERFESRFGREEEEEEEGEFRVLERFNKRSELLRGIENYRVALLEANPRTFMLPHHCDAEALFVVIRGQGTISLVREKKRESHRLERGDIFRVPAGATFYLINQDDDQKLQIFILVHPVNTPGRFEEFFGVGTGENSESLYTAFSDEILEAAFNTKRDRLDRLFGVEKKGVFVKASEEQIEALSRETGASRGRAESRGPYKLLKQRPIFSSRFGKFYGASPDDYEQLRDIDASIAIMHINRGGMVLPYYNSRSTKMVYVARGRGYFEMACPHLRGQSQGSQGRRRGEEETGGGVHYQKVRARLSVGDVFIIPAAHPIIITASQNEDLQLVGFGNNAQHNQIYFLAGRNNVWNQVEAEAKELSFQVASREVDEILRSQEGSHFVAGPQQQQQQQQQHGQTEKETGHYVASVLDFTAFL